MGAIAASEPVEPRAVTAGAPIATARADIVDRQRPAAGDQYGRPTRSTPRPATWSIRPGRRGNWRLHLPRSRPRRSFMRISPESGKFHWIRKTLSPEQQQAVFDIGEPGPVVRSARDAALPERADRGPSAGRDPVRRGGGERGHRWSGVAGVEMAFEARLSDPGPFRRRRWR